VIDALVLGFLVLAGSRQSEAGGWGRVVFETSGATEARPHFLRGVAALHNFAYEEAVEAFQKAQQIDPGFAMAYWGEAMAYNQTLWLNQNPLAAREIVLRLGPTPEARAAKAGTDKEKGFLRAVEILFGAGPKKERDLLYAQAMERLYQRFPDDSEVACFYALALLGTMLRAPALYTEANEETHQHALMGSETQRKVAEILERVLQENPQHPGALHYLIHNYDDPANARLALPAARAYARVAPGSSHALHMPAHVFLQLGLWDEAASADEASYQQSVARAQQKGLGIGMRDYHSLSWLCYEALQQGRFQKAEQTLALIQAAVEGTGANRFKAIRSLMRAQFAVETRRWELLRTEPNFATNAELFAIGMSAAKSGVAYVADLAQKELARRSGSTSAGNLKLDVAIMEKELAALNEMAAGRPESALKLMEEATDLEKEAPPPLGPPRPVKPSHELHAEMLLELGRPKEAILEFQRALERWPNRSLSLLGLARASARVGDRARAQEHYRRFLANWSQADADLPELEEARRALRDAEQK
jgi:tetratricopeptide (TPR) repeat protein